MQALAGGDARLISDRDRNLRAVRLERREVKEDVARIEDELAEIGEEALRALTTERNERTEQIARDKQRHDDGDRKLKDQELVIDDLKAKLRKASVRPDARVERKDQVCKALADLFEASIDAYRTKLRRRVEKRASEIFGGTGLGTGLRWAPDHGSLRARDH